MLEKIYIDEPGHTELNMYRCGIEDCSSGHSWGPAVRDHYIIHYVLGGRGIFQANGQTWRLGEHDCFIIYPNTIVFYQADLEEPWSYAWVGFNGLKAETYVKQAGIRPEYPVFRYDRDSFLKDCFFRMINTKDQLKGREIRLLGLLYEFLSRLIETSGSGSTTAKGSDKKEEYVKKAMEYIRMNYSNKTGIAEIARFIGIDRSYLYSLFLECLKVTPREYLISYRLEKACELMRNKGLSIGDIARSVGYEDPLQFSKAFRKAKGLPPREYRTIYGK